MNSAHTELGPNHFTKSPEIVQKKPEQTAADTYVSLVAAEVALTNQIEELEQQRRNIESRKISAAAVCMAYGIDPSGLPIHQAADKEVQLRVINGVEATVPAERAIGA